MQITKYLKAIVAAVVAGSGALSAAMADSTITGTEWITILAATVGGLGLVGAVPNKKPSVSSAKDA